MSGYHRPVCSKCEIEFVPIQNGVNVIDYEENGAYQIFEADEWGCPECGFRIIKGFGNKPYIRRSVSPESFKNIMVSGLDPDTKRRNYYDMATKEIAEVAK